MQNESRHVKLLEIFSQVSFGERFDAVVGCWESTLHTLQPERVAQTLRHFRAVSISAVEGSAEVFEELRPIRQYVGPNFIKDFYRETTGIRRRLQHQRRHCADKHRFRDALRSMTADVAGDFAAAG